jgi:site-specific DNA-methyltransferase (adenine-specific)
LVLAVARCKLRSQIKPNTIYLENCLNFMSRALRQKFLIDVIVTSPPYNIDKGYNLYDDSISRQEYLLWMNTVASKSVKILRDNGSFFLNIGGTLMDPLIPFEVLREFLKAGYKLQNTIHWIKSISFEKDDLGRNSGFYDNLTVGHFKPITSNRFLTDAHEFIFHLTKTRRTYLDKLAIGVPYQDKTNIGRWKSANRDSRDRGNVWFIPYQTIQKKRPHPAVFPEKLPKLCLLLHGVRPDLIVYDPFIGIGTTALACLSLDAKFVGTEMDKHYIRIAKEHLISRERDIKQEKQ